MKHPMEYGFTKPQASHTHAYLIPTVLKLLKSRDWLAKPRRVFELGCGNGANAAALGRHDFDVSGVDPSTSGIGIANANYPHLNLQIGSSDDDLASVYGQFAAVISLEVIEHVFLPRKFASCVFSLLEPGGTAIISTPYHSYLKNLALSLTGKMGAHFTALWDFGHIKFWSIKTLETLLKETGFRDITFLRVGRVPVLAKSMIAVASRPQT